MIRRVITVSSPGKLFLRDNSLAIFQDGREAARIHLEDMAILILEGEGIEFTATLMAACAAADVVVVTCGPNHLPCAYQVPYPGHGLHPQILRGQFGATLPTKKRLWACLVRAKVRNAGSVCKELLRNDFGLVEMSERVVSGDPTNIEAQAAVVSFGVLFGDEFRRDTEADGLNSLLNYGYAVLRAAVARAVVGAGLDPAVGVWHRNRANAFALADDLIEPLRPLVDRRVWHLAQGNPGPSLNPPTKRELVKVLGENVRWKGKKTPVLVALELFAATFRDALLDGRKEVPCPLI